MEHPSIILRTVCPDRPGLVSHLTSWISNYGGNIKHSDHHTDQDAGLFLSRIEWDTSTSKINKSEIYDELENIEILVGLQYKLPLKLDINVTDKRQRYLKRVYEEWRLR